MNDEVTKQTTVTSNSQAAHLACDTERARVLAILALAPQGAIPETMLQAIASGLPVAQFERQQRTSAAPAKHAAGSAAAQAGASSGGKWDDIAARMNEQRKGAAAPAERAAE